RVADLRRPRRASGRYLAAPPAQRCLLRVCRERTWRSWRFRSLRPEVQVLGDSGAVLTERVREQTDPPSGLRQVAVLEVDVEQVDVPRQFDIVRDVGLDDLPCDRQGRVLRRVVDVAVAGVAELRVLLGEEPLEQFARQPLARLDTNLVVVCGE